jgi:hypothetical protein
MSCPVPPPRSRARRGRDRHWYRPELTDAFFAQTGLTLEPNVPSSQPFKICKSISYQMSRLYKDAALVDENFRSSTSENN